MVKKAGTDWKNLKSVGSIRRFVFYASVMSDTKGGNKDELPDPYNYYYCVAKTKHKYKLSDVEAI
jgi:hypothetical protein